MQMQAEIQCSNLCNGTIEVIVEHISFNKWECTRKIVHFLQQIGLNNTNRTELNDSKSRYASRSNVLSPVKCQTTWKENVYSPKWILEMVSLN